MGGRSGGPCGVVDYSIAAVAAVASALVAVVVAVATVLVVVAAAAFYHFVWETFETLTASWICGRRERVHSY